MGQRGKVFAFACLVAAVSVIAGSAVDFPAAGAATSATRHAQTAGDQWVDAWGASFLSTTVNGAVSSVPSFNNQTYRLNLFTKLGGTQVRVRLTNKFATSSVK